MSMRQQFHPAARPGVVSQLKINPDKPIRPFTTDNSSKHHTPLAPNPESLSSKTKASCNSSDTSLMTSDRSTPVRQSASLPNSKKRSMDRAVSSSSASKKKAKRAPTRRSSKALELNGNIYKDQEWPNFKEDDSQSRGVSTTKYDMLNSSNDAMYSDSKSKRSHHGEPENKPQNAIAYVRGNSDGEASSAEGQVCQHSPNHKIKLNEPHRMDNGITVQAESPSSGSQASMSSRYSPEGIDSTIENGELVEGRDDVYQTPLKKVIPLVHLSPGKIASSSGSSAFVTTLRNVIDMDLRQLTMKKEYKTSALYIAETANWDILTTSIPNDPPKTKEWEATGQEIAKRAAQLVSNYAAHLRDRADLFDRVQKRILGHKQNLMERDKVLMLKHKSVTSQCENVIQEIKTGTI